MAKSYRKKNRQTAKSSSSSPQPQPQEPMAKETSRGSTLMTSSKTCALSVNASEAGDSYPPFGNKRHLGYADVRTRFPGMTARDSVTTKVSCNIHTILPDHKGPDLRNVKVVLPPRLPVSKRPLSRSTASRSPSITTQASLSPTHSNSSTLVATATESAPGTATELDGKLGTEQQHKRQPKQRHNSSNQKHYGYPPIVDSSMVSYYDPEPYIPQMVQGPFYDGYMGYPPPLPPHHHQQLGIPPPLFDPYAYYYYPGGAAVPSSGGQPGMVMMPPMPPPGVYMYPY